MLFIRLSIMRECPYQNTTWTKTTHAEQTLHSLHSSMGSSELSPQSSSTSHFQLWGMQRPFLHLNWPGRHVLLEQCEGSSSEPSPQSFSPSHCHASGMQRLLLHCHWWDSHWCVAERGTNQLTVTHWTLCMFSLNFDPAICICSVRMMTMNNNFAIFSKKALENLCN